MDATERPVIRLKRLRPGEDGDIPLPRYMTEDAAGMDVAAALTEPLTLEPLESALVPTGFAMAIPRGYEVQVRPRSGMAVKRGISLINAPGTIDADYRGEVKIAVVNLSPRPQTIQRGERVAQLVVGRVFTARMEEVEELDETPRNAGGFGHTGTR